ncbi:MAG: hypothetical protein V3V19_11385 [Cocleimonas sp.]
MNIIFDIPKENNNPKTHKFCYDCGSYKFIKTISNIVCTVCGLCTSEKLYSTLQPFKEVADYSQPILTNNKKANEVTDRLLYWIQLEISIEKKITLIVDINTLANEFHILSLNYPSEYYLAAAIIFSKQFIFLSREMVIGYLFNDFNKACGKMLKKIDKLTRDKYDTFGNDLNTGLIYLKDKSNNKNDNHYNEYLSKYWEKKIIQVNNIVNGKKMTQTNVLKKSRLSQNSYYRNKKRLNGYNQYKQLGRPSIIDSCPEAINIILQLYKEGKTLIQIKEYLIDNLLNFVELKIYYKIISLSIQAIRNYILKNRNNI